MDYRGSTGYGRAYRMKLKGNWGIVDIEDVCAGAEYLVEKGQVQGGNLTWMVWFFDATISLSWL